MPIRINDAPHERRQSLTGRLAAFKGFDEVLNFDVRKCYGIEKWKINTGRPETRES